MRYYINNLFDVPVIKSLSWKLQKTLSRLGPSMNQNQGLSIRLILSQGGLAQGWVEFFHTLVNLLESDFENVLVSIKHVFSDSNYACA